MWLTPAQIEMKSRSSHCVVILPFGNTKLLFLYSIFHNMTMCLGTSCHFKLSHSQTTQFVKSINRDTHPSALATCTYTSHYGPLTTHHASGSTRTHHRYTTRTHHHRQDKIESTWQLRNPGCPNSKRHPPPRIEHTQQKTEKDIKSMTASIVVQLQYWAK